MDSKKILISVGRQFGSGGHLVAKELVSKLGIDVYDNELISKAAEESGFSKELFLRSDEKRSLFSVSSFFASARFGIADNYVGDNGLFQIQSDVIRKIAEEKSAIFIGRCSDYILRDMDCLSVFITAPMEARIARVMDREKLDRDSAVTRITRQDKTRETYYNYFTFKNWGMASNYDMCIDSSILGIEGTADLIINLIRNRK